MGVKFWFGHSLALSLDHAVPLKRDCSVPLATSWLGERNDQGYPPIWEDMTGQENELGPRMTWVPAPSSNLTHHLTGCLMGHPLRGWRHSPCIGEWPFGLPPVLFTLLTPSSMESRDTRVRGEDRRDVEPSPVPHRHDPLERVVTHHAWPGVVARGH